MSEEEERQIFPEFHDSAMGGHTGINKTQDAIRYRFLWPHMSADIREWASQENKKQRALNQRLPLNCGRLLKGHCKNI